MDNETLKKLFKAGAILLVLDAPHNQLEFGIDVNCWNTGPRFRGIKIIPPGAHFVYYSLHNTRSAKSNTDETAKEAGTVEVTEGGPTGGDIRIGFWHQFESGEVVVMKWNAYNEEMELEKDQEQIARYKAESIFKDDGFVNSQDDLLDEELSRASKIIDRQQKEEADKATKEKPKQESQLRRTTGTILEEDETEANTEMEAESEAHMEAQIETSKLRKKTEVNTRNGLVDFTIINLRSSFQKGAVGEEVTRYSLDKSWLLNHLFTTAYRSDQDDMTANFLEQALKTMGRNIQSNLKRGQCSDLRKPMLELQKAVLEGFEWKIPGDFKKVQKIVELDTLSDEDDDYEEEGEYAPIIVE
ncbi:hypothetical protein BGX20_002428 [Mortierella sp. AD010]|nr:hypothetical protein BGX20_002428 [Mortierella sp. AD010]